MQLKRLLRAPKKSFFLLGPRGTGKSTWLRQTFPDAYVFDLLSEETFQRLLAKPQTFPMTIQALPANTIVIVDEIQRLPNLLNEVHRLIELDKRRFVLCGSSARKLKSSGTNLLAGRALRRYMHPFTIGEIGDSFDLDEIQTTGMLPVVWDAEKEDKAEVLNAYALLYLKEEVQAEALVRNLPGFARFLPVAAIYHGQNINVTNIAREAGVARTTAAGYLDILGDTLLTFKVPAYETKLRVRERKLPKLYWCDPGLVRAMKKTSGKPSPEEKGALFEGLVAQSIRAYKDYNRICDEFYYWQPAGSSSIEVDFLLTMGPDLVAIEVKSGVNFSENWCRGLRAIAPLANLRRRIIVCPEGPDMKTDDNIEVCGLRKFVEMLDAGCLLK